MRVVIQRVKKAKVKINDSVVGKIDMGLLVLVGVEELDAQEDIDWLSKKIVNLRIFSDKSGHMNRSLLDVDGELLLISQFTLHASTKKGNRPSFLKAAKPVFANEMYEKLKDKLSSLLDKEIESGSFGADMQVELLNDGPVTIVIDTKPKE